MEEVKAREALGYAYEAASFRRAAAAALPGYRSPRGLVNETSRSVTQRLVTEQGFFAETFNNAEFNPLVRSLTPEQRQLLGDMLLHERWGAIHDVLAVLTSWMSSEGLAFTFQGEPMPVKLSGMGLHGDFVGRRQGWEWPSNGGPLDT